MKKFKRHFVTYEISDLCIWIFRNNFELIILKASKMMSKTTNFSLFYLFTIFKLFSTSKISRDQNCRSTGIAILICYSFLKTKCIANMVSSLYFWYCMHRDGRCASVMVKVGKLLSCEQQRCQSSTRHKSGSCGCFL
jgi:hypothetical protein